MIRRLWRSWAIALPTETLEIELRWGSIAATVGFFVLVLAGVSYAPVAKPFFDVSHPWILFTLSLSAGLWSSVSLLFLRAGKVDAARLFQIPDLICYSAVPVMAMVLSTGPGSRFFALGYYFIILHYARTYDRNPLLSVSIGWVPFLLSLTALPDVVTPMLISFGAVGFTIISKNEQLRREQSRREVAHRSAIETTAEAVTAGYDAARGRLAAEVGMTVHEQRNALTPILGELFLLKTYGDLDNEGQETVDRVERCVTRAARAAEVLLHSLRFQEEEGESCFLGEVFELLESSRGAGAGRRGTLEVADFPDVRVVGKAHLTSDVLSTLVANAFEARATSVTVSATVDAEETLVTVQVVDDGPGVAPEIEDLLFEPYITYGKEDGIGLGLYVARMVIEAGGGTLDLSCTGSSGSTFHVCLPIIPNKKRNKLEVKNQDESRRHPRQ